MSDRIDKKRKQLRMSSVILLVITVFTVLTSAVMGTVLSVLSINEMKLMVENKALEMASTAAALLDGDELKNLTKDDVNTPEYQKAVRTMNAFRIANEGTSGELAFIYLCRPDGAGGFEFTIDPSKDPAQWGEILEWSYAVDQAAKGKTAFDTVVCHDRWGSFYSAYSPVFTSDLRVAMIVGIDIWANWFDQTVWSSAVSIIIASVATAAAGIAVGLIINSRIRRRLKAVSADFSELEQDIQTLIGGIKTTSEQPAPIEENGDHMAALREQIANAKKEINDYLEFARRQAYIDSLCKCGNRMAYAERVSASEKAEAYFVAVLDIDGLKYINDHHGHEFGDQAIALIADALKKSFGEEDVFRIGGDEFSILSIGKTLADARQGVEAFEAIIKEINAKSKLPFLLHASVGLAEKEKNYDTHIDVFRKADDAMYQHKEEFYRDNPSLKKKYSR